MKIKFYRLPSCAKSSPQILFESNSHIWNMLPTVGSTVRYEAKNVSESWTLETKTVSSKVVKIEFFKPLYDVLECHVYVE